MKHFPDIRSLKICDLGGSRHFWEKLDIGVPSENITIVNISEGETQSISGRSEGNYQFVIYDGKKLPFDESSFDLLICNSVIEHVSVDRRKHFVSEMKRVSKRLFIQTPAYECFFEPHFILPFIHWLPKKFGRYLVKISPWKVLSRPDDENINIYFYGTNLLRKNEMIVLFGDCSIERELFFFMTKSYYAFRR